MKNALNSNSISTSLTVPTWMRLFMGVICVSPIGLMFWVALKQANNSDSNLLVVIFWTTVIGLAFAWLALRLYSLCTIRITSAEISQTFFFFNGAIVHRCVMPWDAIQSASFSQSTYRFPAKTGEIFELNTSLFSDKEVAISSVRRLLPEIFLKQIDTHKKQHD